jgi:fluoride exporter
MGLVWFVAIGGAAGSALRFLLTGMLQGRAAGAAGFPTGTLVVNVAGSLLLGFILRHAVGGGDGGLGVEARALLGAGFCGGFTTFSAFSVETLGLIEAGDWRRAALYAGLSVGLSLAAAALGFAAGGRAAS